jgi:ribosomal silencing factor RsfS
MSRDEEVKDVRLFDIRTVERNIKRGIITRKDYERHLKSLADAADKVAPAQTEEPAPVETTTEPQQA